MRKSHIIFALIAIFYFVGCASTVEQPDSGLVFIADGIYCELSENNEDVRTYHIRGEISCGQWGQFLVMGIWGIEGVQSVYPQPYEFTISKSCLYEWKDIEAEIVKKCQQVAEQMAIFKAEPEPKADSEGV